jgi:hypothetical protein
MNTFNQDGAMGLFDEGESFLVPLAVPTNAGFEQTVDALLTQLEAIAQQITAVASVGIPALADDPPVPADELEQDEGLDGSGIIERT